ncbi:MAG: ABC transporter substrate-binding protein [Eubacteriales bacterium]|nr:ABC transporter substrate-binding protein [Eubacteriales bacterium]
MLKKTLALILAMTMLFALVACEQPAADKAKDAAKVAEDAADAAKDAADEAKDAAEEAADEAKDAVEDAADQAEEAADEAKDAADEAKDAAKDAKDEAADKADSGKPPHGDADADEEHVDVGALDTMEIKIDYERDPAKPFVMKYPESLVDKYDAAPEFEEYPEKIIVLSTSTLYLLSLMDVEPIAVSRTVKNTRAFDAYGELPWIDSGMNTVDTETIVSMEPDLVIMSGGMREKFGSLLEELKIPVFYTSEGPGVSYAQNKEESLNLAEIFGGQKAKDEVAEIYAKVEDRAKAFKDAHEEKTTMILFGMDSSMQASSKSFFGGIVAQLPFANLTDLDEDKEIRVAPISMENVIKNNPEYIFLIAPPMGYDPNALFGIFMSNVAKDPQLWQNVEAVKNENIIALPGNYTTSKGLEIVQDFNNLINLLEEKLAD